MAQLVDPTSWAEAVCRTEAEVKRRRRACADDTESEAGQRKQQAATHACARTRVCVGLYMRGHLGGGSPGSPG
jgi:hypothetical protein